MNIVLMGVVSFLGALLSSLGMGGGGILLIYLTVAEGMRQQNAQGINLLFFIPIAIVAIIIHAKHGLIRWKMVPLSVGVGLIGVWFGSKLALSLDSQLLSKLFGGFLLVIGLHEIFMKKGRKAAAKSEKQAG